MSKITLHHGDCLEVLRGVPDNSVDACVTDPPYGLGKEPDALAMLRDWMETGHHDVKSKSGFMNREWDAFCPQPALWREVLRVLKPGGHVVAFAGSRTYDLMALGLRIAGFEIRDMAAWLYGCLDSQTQVVTQDGVKYFSSVSVGDLVLCYDPATGGYSLQPILEKVEYAYEDTAFRLVGDFGEQVVSRNHRCIVEHGGREVFRFAETLEQQARVPVLEDMSGLLQAVHERHQGAGHPKQDVWPRVQEHNAQSGAPRQDQTPDGQEGGGGSLRGVRQDRGEAVVPSQTDGCPNMQPRMQRDASRPRTGEAFAQGAGRVDGEIPGLLQAEDDGGEQPRLDGRGCGTVQRRAAQTSGDQARPVSTRISAYGPQGRVRGPAPDTGGAGRGSDSDSHGSGASSESQRRGQRAAQPNAVSHECGAQDVRGWAGHTTAVVRVLPFHLRDRVWCLRVPTGAFVAYRGGVAFPTGNSGFPKNHDVSKAIDKHLGAEREVLGVRDPRGMYDGKERASAAINTNYRAAEGRTDVRDLSQQVMTAPASDEAKNYAGWGSALKPAIEPAVLARKPLEGTIAGNVLKWSTGGLNVDGCRIPHVTVNGGNLADNPHLRESINGGNGGNIFPTETERRVVTPNELGRYPANLAHDGSDEVLSCLPDAPGQQAPVKGTEPSLSATGEAVYGKRDRVAFPLRKQNREGEASADRRYTDKGVTNFAPSPGVRREATSAARFWFNSSDEMPSRIMYHPKAGKKDRANSKHPTVKPVNLMRWLVRMVTPSGGVVLDPFAGSGTTGEAAFEEGFDCILIEREAEYHADIQRRLEGIGAMAPAEDDDLFGDIPTLEDLLGDIPA